MRKLAAIMFTDMVGYTAMMQQNEDHARILRERHKDVLQSIIGHHFGEIVQYYGDGTLSIFSSIKEAVLGAMEIQLQLQKEPQVPLRIGIHIGDIVLEDDGIYGDGVNLASRIESLSVPGAVLFSDMVNSELKNHPEIKSNSLGKFQLKNVEKPIEVFALANTGMVVPSREEIRGKIGQPEKKSIAVLPFVNMSSDPENEYFGEGISEEIINGLTKVSGLSIISRSSSFALKGKQNDPAVIGRGLNVSNILTGSVRKSKDKVRVSVQLINTADGFQLWTEMYERQLEDIFDVQDEIARHVVNNLKANFGLENRARPIIQRTTQNTEAYNLYLKGLYLFNKWNPDDIQKAAATFEEVTRIDPSFSSAFCSLSHCYSFLGSCGIMSPVEAYSKAHEFALKAVEENVSQAESHLALAMIRFFHIWDWKGTKASLDKAIDLGLDSGLLNQIYSLYLATTGDISEAIRRMEKAVQLDPLSLPLICMLGHMYIFNEQFEKAILQYEQALELDPSFRGAVESKGIALLCMSRFDKAIDTFNQYQIMTNHPQKGVTGLGIAYAETGALDKYQECYDKLLLRQKNEPGVSLEMDLAIMHCGIKEYDKAIEYLQKVFDKRFGIVCTGMVFILRCPYFRPLWGKSGFRQLVDRMGLN